MSVSASFPAICVTRSILIFGLSTMHCYDVAAGKGGARPRAGCDRDRRWHSCVDTRTLANAVVILDEAQSPTSMQMKMFRRA